MLSEPLAVQLNRYGASAKVTDSTFEPFPENTIGAGGAAVGTGLGGLAVWPGVAVVATWLGVGVRWLKFAVGLLFGDAAMPMPLMTASDTTTPIAIALTGGDHRVRSVRTIPTGKHRTRPTTAIQPGTPPDTAEGGELAGAPEPYAGTYG